MFKCKMDVKISLVKILKIRLSKPNEWGTFINPETLEIKEIVGEIPEKSIVIIRKKEYRSDLSRSVVNTHYATVSKNSLVYLSKRDVAKRLAKQCAQFMLKTGKIPQKITITRKIVENKPVELIYSFSTNEVFQLYITEELLEGKNPKNFIETLIASSDRDFLKTISEEEKHWKVTYAPDGRALCKKCKRQIKTKEIRIRKMPREEEPSRQEFYHFNCFAFSKIDPNKIHCINDLSEEDQKKIRKKLK